MMVFHFNIAQHNSSADCVYQWHLQLTIVPFRIVCRIYFYCLGLIPLLKRKVDGNNDPNERFVNLMIDSVRISTEFNHI